MKKLVMVALIFVSLVGSVQAADALKLPDKDSTQYWVLRSQAISELIPFITSKRATLKERYSYFDQYMEEIGKASEFAASTIKVPKGAKQRAEILGLLEDFEGREIELPKKVLTWNELVEIAMQFVLVEGYVPVDIQDEEELTSFKNIQKRRETFCRKIRKEAQVVVDSALKGWLYLGSINKQQSFRAYMHEQKTLEKARKDDMRVQRAAASRGARASNKQATRNVRQGNALQLRQDRMRYKYGYNY
jgi:hypothetical protein